MMDHSHIVVEDVPCFNCHTSGKVTRWIFFKRDCPVCDGAGERPIMYDSRLPENVIAMMRRDAITGFNRLQIGGFGNQVANSLFGGLL